MVLYPILFLIYTFDPPSNSDYAVFKLDKLYWKKIHTVMRMTIN